LQRFWIAAIKPVGPRQQARRKEEAMKGIFAVLFVVAFAATLAALPPSEDGGAARLLVQVQAPQGEFRLDEPLVVSWSLTNESDRPLWVLRWFTPVDGIEANIFAVTRNGQPVPYVGKLVKRPAPTPEDYLELQPGQTLQLAVDISAAYDLTVKGDYAVRFREERLVVKESPEGPEVKATVQTLGEAQFWVEGREEGERELQLDLSAMYVGGYTNCTNTQKSTLSSALNYAVTMATNGYNYLVNYGKTSSRYKWWFDYRSNPSSTYFSTVKSHFSAIKDALANQPVTFDCSCTQNYYAYVYPNQPYKIYLCQAFWSAPMTGRDSKAGTLVHEISHFYAVASTDDWAYGATAAHNLAVSQPSKAIDNADNHEYFAEDSY
jgi:peptidyl-Lys metalloendopeptidase